MGNYRYYICPENLIQKADLPPKWGLIYVGQRGKVTVICGHLKGSKQEWFFDCNRDAELGMASLLLAKAGDFEKLNMVNRLNQRLESEIAQLRKRVEELEWPQKHKDIIKGLSDTAKRLKIKS